MRTPKQLYHDERIIYKPELSACPHCGGPLMMCNYLSWDKTVQTLDNVLSIASRPGFCAEPTCPGRHMRLLSAEGQQVAPRHFTYGYDVLVSIGWLRQEHRDTYAEIRTDLAQRVQISESHVRYLYQQVYLPLLACRERQYWTYLEQTVRQYGGLIIALDGLAPEGGEPQLWFIRDLLNGLTLRSGWLSRFDRVTFEALLEPLRHLPWPVLAVLSDKQKGLPEAVAAVLPDARHHFCHAHYLKNLAEPLAKTDSAFKVALRKAVRQEVGLLIRAKKASDSLQPSLLTITGLLPDSLPPTTETTAFPTGAMATRVDEVVTPLLLHTRYLLTLKGRPPFRLAGIETYQRLQGVIELTDELLVHRHEPRLSHLNNGLRVALTLFTSEYQELRRGETWLRDINLLLEPTNDNPFTGQQVAQRLRTYLDDLATLPDLPPPLDTFRRHLNKVSTSYSPGLLRKQLLRHPGTASHQQRSGKPFPGYPAPFTSHHWPEGTNSPRLAAHRRLGTAPQTFYRGQLFGCLARGCRKSVGARTTTPASASAAVSSTYSIYSTC